MRILKLTEFFLIVLSISSILSCHANLLDRYGHLEIENNTPERVRVKAPGIHSYFDLDEGKDIEVLYGILFDLDPFKKKKIRVRVGPYKIEVIAPNKFKKEYSVNVYENPVAFVVIYN